MSSESHPTEFDLRKARILADIASPAPDASPKGSIDVQILPLIDRLNSHADVVTTSSCSGRVSVFLEGRKKTSASREHSNAGPDTMPAAASAANAGAGGKGDGGKWLFVSHDPINTEGLSTPAIAELLLGQKTADQLQYEGSVKMSTRFVHFKFEPMILHIQTRNLETAQCIVSTALSCGFRESGIMNSTTSRHRFPIVAVRCAGLSMDSPIGVYDEDTGAVRRLVSDETLAVLVQFSNLKFEENIQRVQGLASTLEAALFEEASQTPTQWEDKEVRKARKRAEGLRRRQELQKAPSTGQKYELDGDIHVNNIGAFAV
ncbi:methyltransferase TYW3-domain-containing protein [Geopyxis carbonaria]|nr:methyltransferase TYW3-domain-containing protein [Geopyxis carbonaria]